MAQELFANNALTTLASGITNVQTSITVADGSAMPSPTGGDYFRLVLTQAATETLWEVVKVTARSGNTLTVTRGQDGTTARAWSSGDKAEGRLSAGSLGDMAQKAGADFSGSVSVIDGSFSIKGSSDATKIAKFEVDGFTTGTTRTFTLPNADVTVAGSSAALTSGRVPYATTGGLLTDSATLTYSNGLLGVAAAANIDGRVGMGAAGLTALHDNARVISAGVQTPTTLGVTEYGVINLVDVTGNPGQNIYGEMIRPAALRKAATGTHPYMAALLLAPPVGAPSGAGAVGNTAMLQISGVMSEPGANNWSIWSQAGINRFDGGIQGNPSDAYQLKVYSSNLVPDTNNNATLGSTSLRWSHIYGVLGTLTTSLTVPTVYLGSGAYVSHDAGNGLLLQAKNGSVYQFAAINHAANAYLMCAAVGSNTITFRSIAVADTTASASTITGCATFAGGIGVAGAGWFGGDLVTATITQDGQAARSHSMNRHTTSNTAGNSLTINAGGATSGATDKAGGDLILAPGVSTGTGIGGVVKLLRNERAASTGTADNAQSTGLMVIPAKNLTNNSATGIFEVAVASGSSCGGQFLYSIECTDGTDYQEHVGVLSFAAVNKAGTITTGFSHSSGVGGLELDVKSAGTLTDTWTVVAGTGKITITLNANSSLTPTVLRVRGTIINNSAKVITLL